MKIGTRRIAKGLAITLATATAGIVLASGPANAWPKIVLTYPYTSAGARKCSIDLKTAPSGYFCGRIYNPNRWALMTY
ncbi:hypothetical protein [Nonomuraea guangzhouensis]|uniref:Uncharacterized protein n=1 Tax=Nonomuraea guangzhouensis TaxID=1291555 RepID=A0ABW4GQN8_9ACTN|nr:hypothetical protein [Nonomuraea guangzhouensis]